MEATSPRKVILFELNEITWRFLEPMVQDGSLPAFARLIKQGMRATTIAPEEPPNLDPWISWMTVYTGRPQAEHGVKFLEQPPETVHGPRIWDIVADAGKSVGVFGSIMSWPPRSDVKGFWVPGTFSPDGKTFPSELQPIQEMNLTYTRAHTPLAEKNRSSKFSLLSKLLALGLRISTCVNIARYFAGRAVGLSHAWEKVSLQPVINFDFFAALWKKHRPAFATFHSNHVAHYQHRHWRAADPKPFLESPTEKEVEEYGDSIRFGYRVADKLLGQIMAMADASTVVVVASGLGQQPYVNQDHKDGRTVIRIKDIHHLLQLLGIEEGCRPYSVMAPQWNLQFKSEQAAQDAAQRIAAAYYGNPDEPLLAHDVAGNTICVNVLQKLPRPIDWHKRCWFPMSGKDCAMSELCAEQDPTTKQGYHDKAGVLIMAGPGVAASGDIGECSTLDIAPTLLDLLGLQQPKHMVGRVVTEERNVDITSPGLSQSLSLAR